MSHATDQDNHANRERQIFYSVCGTALDPAKTGYDLVLRGTIHAHVLYKGLVDRSCCAV